MSGFVILPGVNPGTDRPLIDIVDPVLPEQGAILLTDLTHPAGPIPAGVPASGSKIPNIALAQAKAMFPALSDDSLRLTHVRASSFDSGGGYAERTSKGGLHFAVAQASAGDINRNATLELTTSLVDVLRASPQNGHDLYVSLWGRVTRGFPSTFTGGAPDHHTIDSNLTFYLRRGSGETNYPIDGRRLGWRASGALNGGTNPGPLFQNIGVTDYGTTTSNKAFIVGNRGATTASYGLFPSLAFYRYYIEDLAVSGRTYAEVDALDWAEYQKQVLTAGGRYYGDTYTDPAVIRP